MIELGEGLIRNCDGLTRRRMLTLGGLSTLGISLPDLYASPANASTSGPGRGKSRREPSCIFIFLNGGPSQYETFDPKPEQPAEIRGPYGAIETSVAGIRISELLPNLSQEMHRFSVIRTLTHTFDVHSARHVMTGSTTGSTTFGAAFTYLKARDSGMPPFFRLGKQILGIGGGKLGAAFDPIHVPDPSQPRVVLPDLDSPATVDAARAGRRLRLADELDQWRRGIETDPIVATRDAAYRRAVTAITSAAVRSALDLGHEPTALRDAYGANKFGQSCLLARRLIEAGTRFVEIKWFGDYSDDSSAFDAWDIHGAELPGLSRMETQLCPRFDHGMATLLRDLDDRGLLESTLVVAVGEFGRTPKMNQWGGRDHWPPCQSVLLAGAGVPRGTILGESDAQGAYPASRPVLLPDFVATIFRLLGVNANDDSRARPFVGAGVPMPEWV